MLKQKADGVANRYPIGCLFFIYFYCLSFSKAAFQCYVLWMNISSRGTIERYITHFNNYVP